MWHCVQIRLFWSFFFFALKASSSLIFSSHFKMYSVNARLPSFIFGVFSFRDTKKKFKVLSLVRSIRIAKKCKSKSIWRVISKLQFHLKNSSNCIIHKLQNANLSQFDELFPKCNFSWKFRQNTWIQTSCHTQNTYCLMWFSVPKPLCDVDSCCPDGPF